MRWEWCTDEKLTEMFHRPMSYRQIAQSFDNATTNQVAGRCHRMGLKRKPKRDVYISRAEQVERENDQRDLDILADLDEGHSVAGTAAYYGVPRSWVRALKMNAQEAGQ